MTDMYTEYEQHDWANEYIVLFESEEEQIVLHRNVLRNEEFVLLVERQASDEVPRSEYLLDLSEYSKLLTHEFKIRCFHKKQDNYKLFNAFFGQTMSEFFKSIVSF
tara:strand:- start:601 stop:918 length:318 start_codon:yes stop_codon:yes gene_type:complete